jgi:hypothetical protein
MDYIRINQYNVRVDTSFPRKATKCPIEMDVLPNSILNRLESKERRLLALQRHRPASDIKLVPSLAAVWEVYWNILTVGRSKQENIFFPTFIKFTKRNWQRPLRSASRKMEE